MCVHMHMGTPCTREAVYIHTYVERERRASERASERERERERERETHTHTHSNEPPPVDLLPPIIEQHIGVAHSQTSDYIVTV